MSKVKICGLRREQDIDYVNELKPDYIGFILTAGFRRSIDAETARLLKSRLDKGITAVGVFVDDDIEKIHSFVSQGIIDTVQLHGNESAAYCKKIQAPVIKYFRPETFGRIREYDVDYLLFDSGTGTGKAFDWSLLPETEKPFFLAGGISADNLRAAIENIHPYAVDLSSAAETDGFKDYNKIKKILEIARNE